MGSKKKWILNTLFLLVILGLTCFGMLHGENPRELLHLLDAANGWYWLAGLCLVVAFICCESLILRILLDYVGESVRRGHCLLYSFIGFFFSSITPSAGGGQPAQVYFMHRDGLDPGITAPVLVVVTIFYKLVLVLFGLLVLILKPVEIMSAPEVARLWCFAGWLLNIGAVFVFCLLIFRASAVERIVKWMLGPLGRFVKRERLVRWGSRLEESILKYREVTDCMQKNLSLFVAVAAISIIQRTLMFAIPWLVLRSFGIAGGTLPGIVIMQAMVSLGTDLLPLPGGTGANEALFLLLFEGLCGETMVLPVLLASRGISYYGQLLVSGMISLYGAAVIGKRRKHDRIL